MIDLQTQPILCGSYALPPSINNEMYHPHVGHRGKGIHKDEIAIQYALDLQNHLDYPDERYTLFRDNVGIRIVRDRQAAQLRKRSLKVGQKPVYYLHCLYCFHDDKRDVDGGHKCFQDALSEWLGINDNRIWQASLHKCIDSAFPHVEFVFGSLAGSERLCTGDLLSVATAAFTLRQPERFYTHETIVS